MAPRKSSWLIVAKWTNDHGPRAKIIGQPCSIESEASEKAAQLQSELDSKEDPRKFTITTQETKTELHRIADGVVHDSPLTRRKIVRAVNQDDYTGLCTACGNEQGGCEPDARQYRCEECGRHSVFGAEELLMMIGG